MSTQLNFGRDINGFNAYAPQPSTTMYSVTLTASTVTSVTVPESHEYWIVAFSIEQTTNVWVDFTGATAIVPVGDTLAPTTSERNPAVRLLLKGTNISMITAGTAIDVGITMYNISYP